MSYNYEPSRSDKRRATQSNSKKGKSSSAAPRLVMSAQSRTFKIVGIVVVFALLASGILMSVGSALSMSQTSVDPTQTQSQG